MRIGVAGLAAVLVVFGVWWWVAGGSDPGEQPVSTLSHEYAGNHLHGLGYGAEQDQLLLATHFGLFSLKDDQLYQVGDSRDDYMGFALHPHDPSIVYTSGHPALGGNLGVERSTDGGLHCEQVFEGVSDEVVDFHSMTMSPGDPDTLYGWFQGLLYRTNDAGDTWEAFDPQGLPSEGLCWGAPCLAASSEDEDRLYAGTPEGLFRSDNQGGDWALVDNSAGAVAGIGVSPHDPEHLFIYSVEQGMLVSNDRGNSWEARNEGLQLDTDDVVFEITFDFDDPERIFVATTGNQVFGSSDGGRSWDRLLDEAHR